MIKALGSSGSLGLSVRRHQGRCELCPREERVRVAVCLEGSQGQGRGRFRDDGRPGEEEPAMAGLVARDDLSANHSTLEQHTCGSYQQVVEAVQSLAASCRL